MYAPIETLTQYKTHMNTSNLVHAAFLEWLSNVSASQLFKIANRNIIRLKLYSLN